MTKRLLSRPLGRCIGPDVHLDFIAIAICAEDRVWSRPSALASGSSSTTRSARSTTSTSAASVAWSRTITWTAASHAIWSLSPNARSFGGRLHVARTSGAGGLLRTARSKKGR